MNNSVTAVDVDGVLLDIHKTLEDRLHREGYESFKMKNVVTYDFNKGFEQDTLGGVPRERIFELFEDVTLFQESSCDMQAISLIRKAAQRGHVFKIYTLSMTAEIQRFKEKLFASWFQGVPNIFFRGTLDGSKPAIDGVSSVIEDSHINLAKYSPETRCLLVDKSYNRLPHNKGYRILTAKNLVRCATTTEAVAKAVGIMID